MASDDGCKTANEQLAYLKATPPINEAEKLIALGKPKFLGTYGYTLEVPGVDDELYDSCYFNKIPSEGIKGTTDYIKHF